MQSSVPDGSLTKALSDVKPWLDVVSILVSVLAAFLSVKAAMVARAARRRLVITEPADGEVNQEFATVSGIGSRRRWRVLVLHRTDRWYLQGEAASPSKHGSWVHEHCHFNTVGAERTVVALAIPRRAVAKLRQAFGGWGPEGNKIPIADWDALLDLLEGAGMRYVLSDPRRIRRVA